MGGKCLKYVEVKDLKSQFERDALSPWDLDQLDPCKEGAVGGLAWVMVVVVVLVIEYKII